MDRDQTIRDAAYAIWEAEGRPEGRDTQHWLQAEKQIHESTKPVQAKKVASRPKAEKSPAVPKPAAPKKATRSKKS